MNPTRDELQLRFGDMSDAELRERVAGGQLTELALEVAMSELAARGLSQEPAEADSGAQGPLRICTRFLLPLDAEIFAARLQADGIAAVVMDSNTIYANGAFHTSLGMGGVRVMVPESQMAEAQQILAAYNAGEFAIDENFDPNP